MNRKRDFSKLVKVYRLLEFLYLGDVTTRSKHVFLNAPNLTYRRSLIVASGRGDFAKVLIKTHSITELHLLDISERMLSFSLRFLLKRNSSVNISAHCCDIHQFKGSGYTFITVHYLLAMFLSEERDIIMNHLHGLLKSGGHLNLVDYDMPNGSFLQGLQRMNLWAAFRFFSLFSDLDAVPLIHLEGSINKNLWEVVEIKSFYGGMFRSYLLKKK